MPSIFCSNIHCDPVNRSWVSVAAMGSTQSGKVTGPVGPSAPVFKVRPRGPRASSPWTKSPVAETGGAGPSAALLLG
jgi:hypothetical protein